MEVFPEEVKGCFNDLFLIIRPLIILGENLKSLQHLLENVQPGIKFNVSWMTFESDGVINEYFESRIDELGDGCIQIPGLGFIKPSVQSLLCIFLPSGVTFINQGETHIGNTIWISLFNLWFSPVT